MDTALATTQNYPITPTDSYNTYYNPATAHPVTTTLTPAQKRQLVQIARQHGHKIVSFFDRLFGHGPVNWKETFRRLEAALIKDPSLRAEIEQMLGGKLTLGKDSWDQDGVLSGTDPTKADGIIRVTKPANDNGYVPGPVVGYPMPGPGINYPSPILYPTPTPFPANSNNGFDQIANDFFTRVLPPMDSRIMELEKKVTDAKTDSERQAAQFELQRLVQQRSEMIAMLSNLMKAVHDSQMAIIQNLRV